LDCRENISEGGDKMKSSEDEFADLYYDVWRSGGNPDDVDRDRFDRDYNGEYDWVNDTEVLGTELERQNCREEEK